MTWCYFCRKDVGFMGWPNHVKMHKKVLGDDCFERARVDRILKKGGRVKVIESSKIREQLTLQLDNKNSEACR